MEESTPNFHGWFQELYLERGGVDDFNLVWIELREQDLDRLEKDIKEGKTALYSRVLLWEIKSR